MGLLVARIAYKMALLPGLALKVAATLSFGLVFPFALEVDMANCPGAAAFEASTLYLFDLTKPRMGLTAFPGPAASKVGAVYLVELRKQTAGRRAFFEQVASHKGKTYLIDLVIVMLMGIAALLGAMVLKEGRMALIELVALRAGA